VFVWGGGGGFYKTGFIDYINVINLSVCQVNLFLTKKKNIIIFYFFFFFFFFFWGGGGPNVQDRF
jgi:hypothetical protein